MKVLVALLALAMPLVGWLSNSGMIGPSNGEISDRYPTLIVAAGYAFAIWGPILLLDVVAHEPLSTTRMLPWTLVLFTGAAALLLTAWMRARPSDAAAQPFRETTQ